MRAIVLVGGEGTRLRPLTLTSPKQMLPVAGRPMLDRVIDQLAAHGIDDVVLSLGYRPDAFIAAYPDGRCGGTRLHFAPEETPLDTAGAIGFAAAHAGIDDTFVVCNGDVLTGLDISELIDAHHRWGAEATISLTPVEDPSAFGVVPTDADGRVLAFIEKPPRDEAPTNLINAGTYVLEPSVLDRIPTGRRVSVEREVFPALVEGGTLFALASDSHWLDVGTPERYLEANLHYRSGNDPSAAGAKIDATATVERAVLGAGVVIGPRAVVSDAVLFDGVKVEEGAAVRSSLVGRGARIGAGATLEDYVVVGDGVEVPAGGSWCGARLGPAD